MSRSPLLLAVLLLALPLAASAQETCGPDPIRFGHHRETAEYGIPLDHGESGGQYYELDSPITITGVEASVYGYHPGLCNWGSGCQNGTAHITFDVDVAIYGVDNAGYPTGAPLATGGGEIPCVCAPSAIQTRHVFDIPDLLVDEPYVVVVENSVPGQSLGVKTNNHFADNGASQNLGRWLAIFEDAPGTWYKGLELTFGDHPINSDVYVHPIIEFELSADFTVESFDGENCPDGSETYYFVGETGIHTSGTYNSAARDIAGPPLSTWDFGDSTNGIGFNTDHLYSQPGAYVASHTLNYSGYTIDCVAEASHTFEQEETYFLDCDHDSYTSSTSVSACGDPADEPGLCANGATPLFEAGSDADCNDSVSSIYPGALEVCNGVDDDCNIQADDDIDDIPLDPVFGVCASNVQVCESGAFEDALDNVIPTNEVCNGLDDDCNGMSDDGIAPIPSANTEGACATNVQVCSGGFVVESAANFTPTPDVCDAVDNDCDPATADGSAEATLDAPCDGDDVDLCDGGVIVCSAGALVCSDGPEVENCDPDTDTDPDTDPDTDSDVDTADPDTSSDTDVDSDTGGLPARVRCGCASSPTGGGVFGFALLGLALLRRRRE